MKGNDLKANAFRFLCTKFTEGACIETASSARIAALVVIPMEPKDNYAGETYEMKATFP